VRETARKIGKVRLGQLKRDLARRKRMERKEEDRQWRI
jgi:hypothetical protein